MVASPPGVWGMCVVVGCRSESDELEEGGEALAAEGLEKMGAVEVEGGVVDVPEGGGAEVDVAQG